MGDCRCPVCNNSVTLVQQNGKSVIAFHHNPMNALCYGSFIPNNIKQKKSRSFGAVSFDIGHLAGNPVGEGN